MEKHTELSSNVVVSGTQITMDVQKCDDKYLVDIRQNGNVAVFSVASVSELKYFLNDIIVVVEKSEL